MENVLEKLLKDSSDEFQKSTASKIKNIETPKCIFDLFFKKCQQYHSQVVHNLQEMKEIKSTKSKGDLFELFCVRYLTLIQGYKKVWLLKELSDELKAELKLPLGQKDYGIDLVCFNPDHQPCYSAVQCKFKTPRPPIAVKNSKNQTKIIYPCVNWKELSTFNELCNASGPWFRRITMTTAPSVRRLGGLKDKKDLSICIKSLQSLTLDDWSKLLRTQIRNLGSQTHPQIKIPIQLKEKIQSTTTANIQAVLTPQQLRDKRLLFYNRLQAQQ